MKIISYIDIGPAIPVQICNSYPKTIAEGRIKYPCLFGHIYKRAVIISHELVSCQRVALLTQGRIGIGTERVYRVIEHEHVQDRKSTRLNSSHVAISYAVFCLKKKNSK